MNQSSVILDEKIIMSAVITKKNLVPEIVWKRKIYEDKEKINKIVEFVKLYLNLLAIRAIDGGEICALKCKSSVEDL